MILKPNVFLEGKSDCFSPIIRRVWNKIVSRASANPLYDVLFDFLPGYAKSTCQLPCHGRFKFEYICVFSMLWKKDTPCSEMACLLQHDNVWSVQLFWRAVFFTCPRIPWWVLLPCGPSLASSWWGMCDPCWHPNAQVTWTDKKLLDVIVPGIELLDHSHLKLLRGKVYFCQFIQFFEIKACGFKHEGKHFLMLLRADTDMVHVFSKPCPEHSPPKAKEFALQYEVSHDW